MDIISSASAVVGLVFNFATAAKTCKAVRGRYKDAGLTIDSIRQELETLQAALQQLANLMMHDASALSSQWDTDRSLSGTFDRVVEGFERTIKGLQAELIKLKFEKETPGRLEKANVVWNEDGMREHLGRLRSQAGALQLLLQVLQVGAVSEVKQHVKNLEAALIQASVSSTKNQFGQSEDFSQLNPHFVEYQGDLLDLEWSEKNSEHVPSRQEPHSADLELLQKEFAASSHHTPTSDSMLIATDPFIFQDAKIRDLQDPFQDDDFLSDSQQPDGKENLEDAIDSSSPKGTPKLPYNLRSINDQSRDPRGLVPNLVSAVIRGDLEKVTELLDSGHDIESRHPQNERTGAMLAALLDNPKVLELLLDRGASVTAEDRDRRTALHFAASEGSDQCTELLLSRKAPVEATDDFKEIPLHRASRYGNSSIVKLLLPYYSDPLERRGIASRNALHLAVIYDRLEVIELICRRIRRIEHLEDCKLKREQATTSPRGCSCPVTFPRLEDVDRLGYTALHHGLKEGNWRAVSSLLKFSKSIADTPLRRGKITNEFLLAQKSLRWTRPLHLAIILKQTEMPRALVDGGADLNLPDCQGFTPLMMAIHTKNEDAAKLLLERGAEFSSSSTKQQSMTVLSEAINVFSPSVLDQLDMKDPCNDILTGRGRAILRGAQSSGRWDIVQSLIENCKQIDSAGKVLDEENTLQYAIDPSTEPVVDLLLANGANPNHRLGNTRNDGWHIPITVAVYRNCLHSARSLLRYGARVLLENSHGRIAVESAIYFGSRKTISWFMEETIAAIKKETRTTQIADKMTQVLIKCAWDACGLGSLEKFELILRLSRQEVDDLLQKDQFLHNAVCCGRIEITKYLLASGADPNQADSRGRSALEVTFCPLEAVGNQSANKKEDYEECIRLVQQSIKRDSPKTSRSAKSSTKKRR